MAARGSGAPSCSATDAPQSSSASRPREARDRSSGSWLASSYRRDRLVADVVGLLDALGLERAHVVAHDWGALVGFQVALDHPERVSSLLTLSVPHPWLRFDPRLLLMLRHAWFDAVVAAPGLGARTLGRGRQRLPRYLLRTYTADPGVLGDDDVEAYLEPLRQPARARAGSAVYRDFILRELGRMLRGVYRDRRLAVPAVALIGDGDVLSDPALLGGYEEHAPGLTVEVLAGVSHYLVDERPGLVVDRARALFARAS